MPKSFHDLPAELVESVLEDLKLDDMRALRLTSTLIDEKISNSSFRNYFRKKRIYVIAQSLQTFVTLTDESHLVRLVDDLTLVGIAGFKSEDVACPEDCDTQGQLLAEALNNIRVKSQRQDLHSLSLEVVTRIGDRFVETEDTLRGSLRVPCKPRPARPVWETIAQTFQLAMVGLFKSQLLVLELDLFTKSHRCALRCDAFPFVLEQDLLPILRNVRKLSMRISDQFPARQRPVRNQANSPVFPIEDSPPCDDFVAQPTLQRYSKATSGHGKAREDDSGGWMIRTWLENFPALESFDLRWFDVRVHSMLPPASSSEPFFDRLGGTLICPGLTRLSLKNVSSSAMGLYQFFRSHYQLQDVVLWHVRLEPLGGIIMLRDWLESEDVQFKYLEIIELCGYSAGNSIISLRVLDRRQSTNPAGKRSMAEIFALEASHEDVKRRNYGPPWRID